MKKKLKPIPKFKNEDEERDFWATADTFEYFDIDSAQIVTFPNLKSSTQKITLEVHPNVLKDIKSLARRRKVSYKTMMANFLAEKIQEETLTK